MSIVCFFLLFLTRRGDIAVPCFASLSIASPCLTPFFPPFSSLFCLVLLLANYPHSWLAGLSVFPIKVKRGLFDGLSCSFYLTSPLSTSLPPYLPLLLVFPFLLFFSFSVLSHESLWICLVRILQTLVFW